MSIGQFARNAIINNPTMKNEEIQALVLAQFPEAKTSVACIAWYKSDMKKKGVVAVPKRTSNVIMAEMEALEKELQATIEEEKQEAKNEEQALKQQLEEIQAKLALIAE